MIVTLVTIRVKPDRVNEFVEATIANHQGSVKEPGNLRFDVLQCKDDPALFNLYEAYTSEEAAKAHKETSHYKKWRETVEEWMAEPRVGTPCTVVAPTDLHGWK